jgi:hypothetical protein
VGRKKKSFLSGGDGNFDSVEDPAAIMGSQVTYGTPFDSDRDNVPVWNQKVTDEKGRQRFHGAFTGGFSAGYFNTVGSKEGWTPTSYTSSRSQRAERVIRTVDDFRDDEDREDEVRNGLVKIHRPAVTDDATLSTEDIALCQSSRGGELLLSQLMRSKNAASNYENWDNATAQKYGLASRLLPASGTGGLGYQAPSNKLQQQYQSQLAKYALSTHSQFGGGDDGDGDEDGDEDGTGGLFTTVRPSTLRGSGAKQLPLPRNLPVQDVDSSSSDEENTNTNASSMHPPSSSTATATATSSFHSARNANASRHTHLATAGKWKHSAGVGGGAAAAAIPQWDTQGRQIPPAFAATSFRDASLPLLQTLQAQFQALQVIVPTEQRDKNHNHNQNQNLNQRAANEVTTLQQVLPEKDMEEMEKDNQKEKENQTEMERESDGEEEDMMETDVQQLEALVRAQTKMNFLPFSEEVGKYRRYLRFVLQFIRNRHWAAIPIDPAEAKEFEMCYRMFSSMSTQMQDRFTSAKSEQTATATQTATQTAGDRKKASQREEAPIVVEEHVWQVPRLLAKRFGVRLPAATAATGETSMVQGGVDSAQTLKPLTTLPDIPPSERYDPFEAIEEQEAAALQRMEARIAASSSSSSSSAAVATAAAAEMAHPGMDVFASIFGNDSESECESEEVNVPAIGDVPISHSISPVEVPLPPTSSLPMASSSSGWVEEPAEVVGDLEEVSVESARLLASQRKQSQKRSRHNRRFI